jgi:putative membrane protein
MNKKASYSLTDHPWFWVNCFLILAYGVWSFQLQQAFSTVLDPFTRNLIEQAILTAFFLIHALSYFNPKQVLAFALICFVVSNLLENTSVVYGFPFGYFHHSTSTGPRLFNIPLLATPTYMAMGYISWMVTQVLLERFKPKQWSENIWSTALVASFVFSIWDFCNDAVFHTLNKAFFYDQPGPWFGVPVSNFLGWLFTTFIFYGLFSWYLSNQKIGPRQQQEVVEKPFWLQVILLYLLNAMAGIYRNINGKSFEVKLNNGNVWQSQTIYSSMTLTTIFTMIFISILAVSILYKQQKQ